MGSEIIVLFIPLCIPCIAYFVHRSFPRGKRLVAFIYVLLALAGVVSFILFTDVGAEASTYVFMFGVMFLIISLIYITISAVASSVKSITKK